MNIHAGTPHSMLQSGQFNQNGQVSNEQLLQNPNLAKELILNSAQMSDSMQIMQFLQNLSQGDIFHATIKDIKNMNVLLQLPNGLELQAKMGEAMNLNIEQELTFEVKANTEQGLVLRPAEHEKIPAELIKKSLQSAGLAHNDKNSGIVKALILQGQPIHKDSIINTLKLMNRYPTEPIEKLIEMNKHGLEINQESLKQFDNYQTGNYKLTTQMQQLSNSLGDYAADTKNVSFSQVNSLFEKLAVIEQGFGTEQTVSKDMMKETIQQDLFINSNVSDKNLQHSDVMIDVDRNQIDNLQEQRTSLQFSETVSNENLQEIISYENLQETVKQALKSANTFQDISNILKALEELKMTGEDARQIMQSEELKQAITRVFDDQFFLDLKPEDEVGLEKQEIKQVYEKMLQIADTLLEAESKNMTGNEKLTQAASDLKSNLQFMMDVNQFANYIQIPYKVNERQEQSDLYVYGRKKQKQGQDEKITAFLHLDLEALGATDVHVELVNQSVSTRFVLDNRESELLVEKHLHELEERLRQKGYQVELKTETIERQSGAEHTVFDKIMQEDETVSNIKRYSFDIRA